ncbi:MAG: hypothetical protein ABJQ14_01430 [Hyphomicrobiales bacterium]
MRIAIDLAVVILLRVQRRDRDEPRSDASNRRAVLGNPVLWRAADDMASRNEDYLVNEKRIRRLMRLMGLLPTYQKPNTSKAAKGHKTYPYLLSGLHVDRPN